MHRFFTTGERDSELLTITNPDQVRQIKDILQLKPGEQIAVVPGDGSELVCEIVSVDKKTVAVGVLETRKPQIEPERKVTLYCAVLKRDNFELVVQKATEIGVCRIVPLITDRTIKLGINQERLHKISIEAVEQSGRVVAPVISGPMAFREVLKEKHGEPCYFFDFTEQQFSVEDCRGVSALSLFVGPEGGWTPEERVLAEEHGYHVRALGKTVLRGETAAIVGAYLAVFAK